MVKVEGTLEELTAMFGEPQLGRFGSSPKRKVNRPKKVASKVKRPLNAWQKYVKANSNKFKYKSGAKKGQINLKAMSRAFKKTRKGKK